MRKMTLTEFKENSKLEYMRVIRTGLFGNLAYEILRSIEGQLSDGYWENSPAMEKYWKNEFIVVDDNTDEVLIVVSDKSYDLKKVQGRWSYRNQCFDYRMVTVINPFYGMTPEKIKSWFADKIRKIVKVEEADNGMKNWWKAGYGIELEYLGYDEKITVYDCKETYKALKGMV